MQTQLEQDFGAMVRNLRKPPGQIQQTLNPVRIDLIHGGIGIAKEAGEILDIVNRVCIYGKTFDDMAPDGKQTLRENLIEELGDLEFYLELVREIAGISREEVLRHNILKLGIRYPTKTYTDLLASSRLDKKMEYLTFKVGIDGVYAFALCGDDLQRGTVEFCEINSEVTPFAAKANAIANLKKTLKVDESTTIIQIQEDEQRS